LRLTEIGGAGIVARFAEVAESVVRPQSEPIPVEDMVVVEKASPTKLRQLLDDYDASEPVVMTVPVGRGRRYSRAALLAYPGDPFSPRRAYRGGLRGPDGLTRRREHDEET
jgi:hypothetical protein